MLSLVSITPLMSSADWRHRGVAAKPVVFSRQEGREDPQEQAQCDERGAAAAAEAAPRGDGRWLSAHRVLKEEESGVV